MKTLSHEKKSSNLEKTVIAEPVKCQHCGKRINEETAYRGPYQGIYCNENCYKMFCED